MICQAFSLEIERHADLWQRSARISAQNEFLHEPVELLQGKDEPLAESPEMVVELSSPPSVIRVRQEGPCSQSVEDPQDTASEHHRLGRRDPLPGDGREFSMDSVIRRHVAFRRRDIFPK